MTQLRPVLATAILLSGLAMPAAAEMKFENDSGGHVLLYGQFNPAWQSFDDGVSTKNTVVDSGHSNSRVGIWVRQPLGANQFSFNFETGLGFRPSGAVTQVFTPDAFNWDRVDIRKVDFALKTENAGTFYLGQGSVATDGAAESDLSGTTLANYASIGDSAGAFVFRTAAGALSLRPVGALMTDLDGGRRARVRYDTPSFGGFVVSASWGKEVLVKNANIEGAHVALRYAGEVGGFTLRGAVGYAAIDSGLAGKVYNTMGSFSALHTSGFNVTVAAGSRRNSGDYIYGKLGYKGDWFGIGTTAVAVDYYSSNDFVVAGTDADAVGFGVVQSIDSANVDAYLELRQYGLAEPGVAYRDASSVLFGARWQF